MNLIQISMGTWGYYGLFRNNQVEDSNRITGEGETHGASWRGLANEGARE